jgi:hypothetical protein
VCEENAAFYYRRHGIRTIAYRLGMFVPESFVGYGFRLLKGGVDDRDVAQEFLLGLALKRGDRSHYPYANLPWWGA